MDADLKTYLAEMEERLTQRMIAVDDRIPALEHKR